MWASAQAAPAQELVAGRAQEVSVTLAQELVAGRAQEVSVAQAQGASAWVVSAEPGRKLVAVPAQSAELGPVAQPVDRRHRRRS
jgi:hypothetical protein